MKTQIFKLAFAAACFTVMTAACSSNSNNSGTSDSDSIYTDTTMNDMGPMSTDTMGVDTTGSGVMSDTPGTGSSPTL